MLEIIFIKKNPPRFITFMILVKKIFQLYRNNKNVFFKERSKQLRVVFKAYYANKISNSHLTNFLFEIYV